MINNNYFLLGSIIFILGIAFLLEKLDFLKKTFDIYNDIYKSSLKKIFFVVQLLNGIYHKITFVIISAGMMKVAVTPSPDNCGVVNQKVVWFGKMTLFPNLDRSIYPDKSCPILTDFCAISTRENQYETFAQYYQLLLLGYPNVYMPADVAGNLGIFTNICETFITVRGVNECGFDSNTNKVFIKYIYIYLNIYRYFSFIYIYSALEQLMDRVIFF